MIVAANKAEGRGGEAGRLEAYALGLGDPIALSAEHGEGVVDLFEALRPHVEREDGEATSPKRTRKAAPLKLAIVGRPNAGKSTLVNRMLGEERMITGPEAGITRDSISLDWEWNGRPVRLVDTAGLRKRAKVDDKLERLSAADTRRAIDHAEVVVLLLDATRGLEVQDLQDRRPVLEEGRGLVIALNKWDVAENASSLFNGVKAALEEGPVATEGRAAADRLGQDRQGHRPAARRRVRAARGLVAAGRRPASSTAGSSARSRPIRRPRPAASGSSCATSPRSRSRPPSFVVFGNRVDQLPESYRRYLVNSMRRDLKLGRGAAAADHRARRRIRSITDKARR